MRRTLLAVIITAITLFLAGSVLAANPYSKPDNAWISISGTVDSVEPDRFLLDYGEGTITVEMDDGDRDADAYKLMSGDKVEVSGFIDDDFFENTTIEASSVYVENLGTYFFASGVDEEEAIVIHPSPLVVSSTIVRGLVTDVDEEEFTVNSAGRAVRVEVEEMPYNPLDDKGYLKIEVGDRVSVAGNMDDDLFEERELVADSVVVLSD